MRTYDRRGITLERNILQTLEQSMPELTKLQKRVADYIIKNPMAAAFSTVDQLAHSVGTSTTTVVRLAMSSGFSGYVDFQRAIQQYVQNEASPSRRMELNLLDRSRKKNIVKDIVELQLDNLRQTYDAVSDSQLQRAVRFMVQAAHLYIAGSRSCYGMAYYLNFNIDRMCGNSDLLQPNPGEAVEQLKRIGKGDALIAIGVARYNRIIVDLARFVKRRGAPVIVITDSYQSPLTEHADVSFIAECNSADFHNSMTGPLLLVELLIALCAREKPEQVKRMLKTSEGYLAEMDVMMPK